MTFAAVWACVRVISESVAALPWHVYRRTNSGRELSDGSAGWLLNTQPNSEMTAFAFRETLCAHALTWGNGYAEIERDLARRPVALWIIEPDRVQPIRDASTGALLYRVSNPRGGQLDLPPGDILHLHGLGFDGICGYSPVRMASRSIGAGIAQDTFAAAFYGNGTVLGGVLEPGRVMNADQIKATDDYFNERHGGPANAFRTRIAPPGSKFTKLDMPMTDAQFLESRKFSVTEVARWFRVPPHKIADLDRSTNNNIEHQSIEFVTDTLVPWVRRLELEADTKLVGPKSQGNVYTKIEVNALLRGDITARSNFYRTMVTIGAMSINEVRELEDFNGIGPAGDAHFLQVNQTTVEKLIEQPTDQTQQPAADPAADPGQQEDATTNVIRREALAWWRENQREVA